MKFSSSRLVIKLSVSDMLKSSRFYRDVLGFTVNENYTINAGGNFGMDSYVELDMPAAKGHFSIGLYKDIISPLSPAPNVGSVPSFIVDDVNAALDYLQSKKVEIDKAGGAIIKNESDKGYVDEFFFFRDPDNNSLVIRQNMNKKM